jgi:hypothetical protein
MSLAVLRIWAVYSGVPDPDFIHPGSRIEKQQQKRRGKQIIVLPFSVGTNITKFKLIYFKLGKKKFRSNVQRIIELFTQKIFIKLSKICLGNQNPGSEIRDTEKTYSGSRGQKGIGSRIPGPGSGSATLVITRLQ